MHSIEHADQFVHLLDDGESLPITMTGMLHAAGFKTRSYSSVGEILETQRTGPRGCFVLDVHMAGGLCGLELQAELIRRDNRLPIIFLTDHGDISTSVKAIKAGASDFLTKQTTHKVFLAAVAVAMMKEQKMWSSRQ